MSALFVALLIGLSGCARDSSDVLGQAYVAPASLNLRGEIGQKNNTVAVLQHGQLVSIIDVRRRFVKVRTQKGEEGWLDSLQLLSSAQMDQIRRETQRALAMPSEGQAGVYEALNIHLEPNRQSPAFARIPESGSVSVLAHRIEPRTSGPLKLPQLVSERPKQLSPRQRRARQARNVNRFLPPPPPPPKPPANWQELSAERIDNNESTADMKARKDEEAADKKAAEIQKPVILENWTLVRTKNGECGWVLSRNLVMSIPDEVAQYAEGKRITSYFDLGAVQDETKGVKHNWLWTTASREEAFDYDSWRVFLWNRRHHRYETSYRQRDLEGYFPVHVEAPDANAAGRTFELITKDDDAKFRRRTYLFDGVRVHLTATQEYNPAAVSTEPSSSALELNKLQPKPRRGWFQREWSGLKQRLLGAG